MTARQTDEKVDDYAIILRHTRQYEGAKQIVFILAGFTEDGTYAAADYLATKWHDLWRKYLNTDDKVSDGRFLQLIHGKSPYDPGALWSPVPGFKDITPSNMQNSHGIPWCSAPKVE
jgi:hypothetical protein